MRHGVFLFCLLPILVLNLCQCRGNRLGIVGAPDVAGIYRGVLEGISVTNVEDLNTSAPVIIDIDLYHSLQITSESDVLAILESDLIPKIRAVVVGMGEVALNLEFVQFDGIDLSRPRQWNLTGLQTKQILFVKHDGEWILTLQVVKMGTDNKPIGESVNAYQYVSYPAATAEAMGRDEAIQYVNTILRLASDAQRGQ